MPVRAHRDDGYLWILTSGNSLSAADESKGYLLQVEQGDLNRVVAATGAQIQTTVNNLDSKALGSCAEFEERQVRFKLARFNAL